MRAQPAITEFRLLCETMAATLPGRPKWILDPRAAGRRLLWLADPERISPRHSSVPCPRPNPNLSRFRGEWIT